LSDGARRLLCIGGIITEKLRLAATVGGLVTHPICDCWIVGDVSKAKERLRFPHEKS